MSEANDQNKESTQSPTSKAKCPVSHNSTVFSTISKKESGCPMKQKAYNVYGEEIDPSNNMPPPNQNPSPGQRMSLSINRIQSTIPKGGTDSTWAYPSPQMFFNALSRKNKVEDVMEEDIETIVAIHNNMNEKTWKRVMEWEKFHCNECPDPKLLKFTGRPDKLSPKSWIKHNILGYPLPFDRHDWIVDRCGKEVRYVIDYYHDQSKAERDRIPSLHDEEAVSSIELDVRPAIDSLSAVIDRIKMNFLGPSTTPNTPTIQSSTSIQTNTLQSSNMTWERMLSQCKQAHDAVRSCTDEVSCSKAEIGLKYCLGSVACPKQAEKFISALESDLEEDVVENALNELDSCLLRVANARNAQSQ